jgi:hypothetical protein
VSSASDPPPVRIEPEPPQEVRDALVRVLDRDIHPRRAPSAWWLEGVRESVDEDVYNETVAPPGSSRGATRA